MVRFVEIDGVAHEVLPSGVGKMYASVNGNVVTRAPGAPGATQDAELAVRGFIPCTMAQACEAYCRGHTAEGRDGRPGLSLADAKAAFEAVAQYALQAAPVIAAAVSPLVAAAVATIAPVSREVVETALGKYRSKR